jgi:hypothetical protein
MTKRIPLLIAVLLAAFTVAAVHAKSYDFNLNATTVAGGAELPVGQYRVEVKDGTATLTNVESGKNTKVPVKITNADKKFKATMVDCDSTVKPQRLRFIELGGSTTRLEFEK